jgi:hypothetical protein
MDAIPRSGKSASVGVVSRSEPTDEIERTDRAAVGRYPLRNGGLREYPDVIQAILYIHRRPEPSSGTQFPVTL